MTKGYQTLSGLGQINEDYDVILCDIWGVIHNGRRPFWEACAALERFRQERGPVVLVSNSPRPSVAIPEQFRQIGVPGEFYDAIVTSGDATIDELSRRAPGPAFRLGPDRDEPIYKTLEMDFSDLDKAKFISCTGLFDDENETPDDYVELLTEAHEKHLPLVCANPDIQVKRGDKIIYCGGALAQLYQEIGGEVIYAGKPHPPIYRLCRAWIKETLGYLPDKTRTLMIGDNILTDLRGAQREGYDCLFIADGLYEGTEARLRALLIEHEIHARYMSPKLIW